MRLNVYPSALAIFLSCIGACTSPGSSTCLAPAPTAPGLEWLYTMYVNCNPSITEMQGPRGIRAAIPIIGGNFTGPRLNGNILDLGADWGLTDTQTGIFSADTRYNLRTEDGANIFVQSSGPAQQNGDLHLRFIYETGDKAYYWLNNVIAVGVLQNVATLPNGTFTLRIDSWHLSGEYNQTTFVNGSTY